MPQASALNKKMSASSAKKPAAIPTTAPCASRFAFSSISVLASSISSRINIEAFSDTCVTMSPSDLSSTLPFTGLDPPSATDMPHDPGEEEASDQGGADDHG